MVEGTTRRNLIKAAAAIPLAASFGLAFSPLFRFFLPTRQPLDLFGPSDQPKALEPVTFTDSDFPEDWTALEFTFQQTYTEYNPEGMEVRKIPGFAVRVPQTDGQYEIVAYSRICPHLGCIFNFVKDPDETAKGYNFRPDGPVFACPCHLSVYDIAQNGKVVSGPAPRPPRRFEIKKEGGSYNIISLEAGGIA
jgi:Rieske Fe-S protein